MNTRYYLLFICCLFLQHFVSAQILYTPKGNTFRGIIRTNELSSTEKNNIYNYIQDNYPNATRLGEATVTYNCHSYAWNITCGGPTCWVNSEANNVNISINWSDGSYIETSENSAEKIFYYNGDHSAVVSSVSGMYESKWGAWPLMRHAPGYGPKDYNMNDRRYYKRNIPGTIFTGPSLLNKTGTTTISLANSMGTPHYYSWSCSSNLEIVSSTATSITVSPKSNKSGWIKMNNHNKELEFKTWYGTPVLEISGESRVPNGEYANFRAEYDFASSPTAFEWILNPLNGNTLYGENSANLDIAFYNAGTYQLVVRATNAHGVGEYCVKGITVYDNTYSKTQIYPNPVSDILNINLQSDKQINSGANEGYYIINLFNGLGSLVKQVSTKGDKTQINVSNLPNGYYYLHIYFGENKKPEIHKVIVKH